MATWHRLYSKKYLVVVVASGQEEYLPRARGIFLGYTKMHTYSMYIVR